MDKVAGVVKAEEFIARNSGKRGAIVISFRTPEERNEAAETMGIGKIKLSPAYSPRSNGNAYPELEHIGQVGNAIVMQYVIRALK